MGTVLLPRTLTGTATTTTLTEIKTTSQKDLGEKETDPWRLRVMTAAIAPSWTTAGRAKVTANPGPRLSKLCPLNLDPQVIAKESCCCCSLCPVLWSCYLWINLGMMPPELIERLQLCCHGDDSGIMFFNLKEQHLWIVWWMCLVQ